ncbi:MAG: oligosaccharide flippase family protein [Bacteroidales bacterium]|nr:oligosaccharide flippase family protein [Bacteroidales bacterium]
MSNNPIKALAGQTVIYGMGTIIPRLLNYLLVPLYTRVFVAGVYGQITDLYAWIALLLAMLTYGMETTFFRYTQKEDPDRVFNNIVSCIITTTSVFLLIYIIFYKNFAHLIQYEHNTQYVLFLGLIVALDALTAVPFAKLRKNNKAKLFTLIKIANVSLNIGLNLFFLIVIPDTALAISEKVFGPQAGLLVWVLVSNVLSSLLSLLLLLPQFKGFHFTLDKSLIRPMLAYSLPILLISLVGMVNEVADKILIKYLTPIPEPETLEVLEMTGEEYALQQLGIYGANFKLAVLMTIFIQMFRYASEPFFFGKAKDRNAPELYAKVMTYFVIFCLLIFLGVMLYMDLLKYFVGEKGSDYHEGLIIVPIVLIANMFYGIVFNLSIWFKLTDRTFSGTIISIIGASVTLLCLFILVPRIGYLGAAIAHLGCYTVMMLVSYIWGQKVFPVPYQVGRIMLYFIFAIALFMVSTMLSDYNLPVRLLFNTLLIFIYIVTVFFAERKNPLKI